MAYTATRSIIDDLEMEVETWRDRAERAEAILYGTRWGVAVRPLTLQQTRVMRLIARRPMNYAQMVAALEADYPDINENTPKVLMSRMRRILPENISPQRCAHFHTVTVADMAALRAFLGETI